MKVSIIQLQTGHKQVPSRESVGRSEGLAPTLGLGVGGVGGAVVLYVAWMATLETQGQKEDSGLCLGFRWVNDPESVLCQFHLVLDLLADIV